MKKTSRILAAVLTLLMVFALCPAAALAEGEPVAKTIPATGVSQGPNPVYNGQPQTVAVSIKDGENALTEGVDYSVSGNTATDAGDYMYTVTGMGNYTGTFQMPYSILKAQPEDMTITVGSFPGLDATVDFNAFFKEGGILNPLIVSDPDSILAEARYATTPNGVYYKLNATAASGKSATITVNVAYPEVSNYKSYNINIVITAKDASIVFDANGGSGSMDAVKVPYGTEYVLPECEFTAPEHMHFVKWDEGMAGDTYTVKSDVILVAQWDWDDIYATATFDFNDGTGNATTVGNTGKYNTGVDFTAIDGGSRKCYTFGGWDLNGTVIPAGGKFNTMNDVTLTAIWKLNPLKSYTLYFDANGGKDAPAPITATSRCGEVYITIPEQIPTKGDEKFVGWSMSQTSPDGIVGPGFQMQLTDEFPSYTLYAVWGDANPKTGDESNIALWAALAGISAAAAAAVLVLGRKKNRG